MLLRGDAQLVVEGVVPDLLHVVPVGHDPVLDRVLEGEHAALGLRLVPHIGLPDAGGRTQQSEETVANVVTIEGEPRLWILKRG